jgi:spermidine/putrescine transport system ATP-binding protein
LIDDRDVTNDGPEVRPLNTVFQNYALFPHLNVFDNVAFGLRFEDPKPSTESVRERVMRALDLVALGSFADRKVPALSGGEQQRVALARALVLEPSVLLLDEPLGALDAQLRARLQVELATLQRQIGITFIYVTHDQHEAFTMSDRIGVMREGRLVQVGTPREIYETPATVDVAKFVGAANVLEATVVAPGSVEIGGRRFAASGANHAGRVVAMIRPERIHVGSGDTTATVERIIFAGSILRITVRVGDVDLVAEVPNDERSRDIVEGQSTTIEVLADAVRVLGSN